MNKEKITIAVDAMGGDHAPRITVEGVCLALAEDPRVRILLIGDEQKIKAELKEHAAFGERITLVHTPDEITMEDHPKEAILQKPNASVLVAARLLSEGKADAMVSAGSTGAVILSAATHIRRISGVNRTALGTVFPTLNERQRPGIFSLMMDIGANVSNSADDLVHFAYMGTSYAKKILRIAEPTVGLLNIGAEEHKGNETMKQAYKLLSSRPDIDFIGNIEGNDLIKGKADIIVSEGMTGNIAIKTMEGTSEAVKKIAKMAMKGKLIWKIGLLCLSGGIKKLMKVASYEEYGGAPIFGFDKLVIKSHGRSSAYAFKNGIRAAVRAVEDDMIPAMREAIKKFETEKS
ncbi:MAG: phosphate acyltransferase PlsX [Candidatus Marinimicrobia bacterium]|nr:phosphate acyltransferase PlsX [Candidatus Neomarinimicrobiota bacterium]